MRVRLPKTRDSGFLESTTWIALKSRSEGALSELCLGQKIEVRASSNPQGRCIRDRPLG